MINFFMAVLPSAIAFLKFIPGFVRWFLNSVEDSQITREEFAKGIDMYWPKKDAAGNLLPIQMPWGPGNKVK